MNAMRRKVSAHLIRCGSKSVCVTTRLLRYWFDVINWGWFQGKLARPKFVVKSRLVGAWAYCWYSPSGTELVFPCRFASRAEFLGVLCHEIIHCWQHQAGLQLDHGHLFQRTAIRIGLNYISG